jgi:hypothetical protein
MTPLHTFENALTPKQRRLFKALNTPGKIQQFLDTIRYHEDETYHCPLTTMKTGTGCCFEGALLAAAAFRNFGKKPLVITLVAEDDDDHVLAIYKKQGRWGAVAKSIYPGLRSRQPVYRTLRELVMSYFEFYYNRRGKRTLRDYSVPLDLEKFDGKNWMEKDEAINLVSNALDRIRHIKLLSGNTSAQLPKMDAWTYKAGMLGTAILVKNR